MGTRGRNGADLRTAIAETTRKHYARIRAMSIEELERAIDLKHWADDNGYELDDYQAELAFKRKALDD